MKNRPNPETLIGKDPKEVPMSLQRILKESSPVDSVWIGPSEAIKLSKEEQEAYDAAFTIIRHMAVKMPRAHSSGHPGGPLSSFTFAYFLSVMRDPKVDQPLRYSAGHLSVLAYTLQYLFGREGRDERLSSVENLIESFRIPKGLPGHVEAGIGDIPFGTGPLGKGVSNALGAAFGLKIQKKEGVVDVLLADGDSQEGQVAEAFRLAVHLKLDNLIVHGDWNDIQLSGIPSRTVAADFAAIAAATGWRVLEVQNGNDVAQAKAALTLAHTFVGKGKPIFLCYYTTMGAGIPVMEEGSNSTKKNFHGSPLSDEDAEKALASLPDLKAAVEAYEPFRQRERKRFTAGKLETDIKLTFDGAKLKGYTRSVTPKKGAARKDLGATHILNMMKADPRIVVLHADLAGSGGFDAVEKEFPERCINVGVAEANMYMMAAGMRQTGLLPVTYTFAAFGTNEARASARLIDVNCGHTRCGIVNDCTHAGLSVGEDGETHQERHYFNIPFDNTEVWMPADSNQAAAMAEKAFEMIGEGHKSVYIFSPRSGHPQLLTESGEPLYGNTYTFDHSATLVHGRGDLKDVATIIATGISVHDAIEAAKKVEAEEQVSIRVLNVASIRPLDASAMMQAALETIHLVVVEDHSSESGLAAQVANLIADYKLPCSLRRLGVNLYYPSGSAEDLKLLAGLDAESIADAVQDELRREVCGGEDVFSSTIFTFSHLRNLSRFGESAEPYVQRLKGEAGYLESLRAAWMKRACPRDKIPSVQNLREVL
ncbi:MAG TPA: transketolase C-terminal domain-containing protein [Candidatus Peribacterales bacterium]|nr:transketolase C-terminal domain-containing protein [Candidatus Peribacterales bacterium]